jgi:ribulose-bisphosphate carboxylase large chain
MKSGDYIKVTYYIECTGSPMDAINKIIRGQSIGNPGIKSEHETEMLIEKHSCKLIDFLHHNNTVTATIGFPLANLGYGDGIAQLLVQIMGGQLEFPEILKCQIKDIEFPDEYRERFPEPYFGITGIRNYLGVYDKPLLGGIIKPKIGMSPNKLLDVVKEMAENGCDVIKEDEIMGDPGSCKLWKRFDRIINYLQNIDKKIIYLFSCNNQIFPLLDHDETDVIPGVHINFWAGFDAFLWENFNGFKFFQKSGIDILTNPRHDFHISWKVICKIATLLGIDFIHAGMWGGYSRDTEISLTENLEILRDANIMPSLSCGMNPGLVNAITNRFGVDYLANTGGAIHGHPGGTGAGVRAMRQAIDGNYGSEYYQAIDKWGIKE